MRRTARRASFALCLTAVLLCGSTASARTERLRWTQPTSPLFDNFKVYWGTSSGSYSSSVSVGVPSKDSTGAYFYDLSVPDTATVYVAVSAALQGLESPKSNQISRAPATGGTPPPPPAGASSGVVGFTLWNALNDSVIDSDFQSGEAISDAIRSCAAIEIRGNAYLNTSGAGSIKKVFDGQDNGCSGNALENSAPYGWENGANASQFECAPSLSAAGSHTLTVTPYDGDNCSGAAGTPVTLTFTVSGGTGGGGSTTVGTPGQPYIVP
jgi:hypothetical protein